jgi:hypothetical protein
LYSSWLHSQSPREALVPVLWVPMLASLFLMIKIYAWSWFSYSDQHLHKPFLPLLLALN